MKVHTDSLRAQCFNKETILVEQLAYRTRMLTEIVVIAVSKHKASSRTH